MSERPRRSWLTICVLMILLLPVLYVVSFGPACWWAMGDTARITRVAAIYEPLLAEPVPVKLQKSLLSYGEIFSNSDTTARIFLEIYPPIFDLEAIFEVE